MTYCNKESACLSSQGTPCHCHRACNQSHKSTAFPSLQEHKREKLLKTDVAVLFNRVCKFNQLTPKMYSY